MHLILYVKPGCHLCDGARAVIRVADPDLVVEEKDITTNPGLTARFGHRIPVLEHPHTGRALDWPFGPPDIDDLAAETTGHPPGTQKDRGGSP